VEKFAYKLDDVDDAENIKSSSAGRDFDYYLVAGGGYTGIEVATNLRRYFNKKNSAKRIIIVERAASILGPLPQWMKDYVLPNLKKMNIEIMTDTVISEVQERRVFLENGNVFDNSMLIWTAGVKCADFIQGLDLKKNRQGRLEVDKFLKINDSCFAAGDSANFAFRQSSLRMAVQFAIV